ncbi:hypothetical protein HanRHA438_Chr10g0440581 [Helianthus annuus]|nr:hypothetical protein HanXRQr2_Chr17g0829821 [Helianthus annuus]KAF5767956.1 hypothetical protein HanXRQr2_Chr14g0630721 [Helianthus annuus]KAJ0631618.1 hypothetical protein HanLR1_Chr17g0655981 [Helianthus annuus]KAJ0635525.1 hypothetical protein HanOQP8_Chr17g0651891 [Helianthus annuus]KAJ0878510.1 hypothetical protein HanRHA438_Chr10g0440581 [Helianthus annuus]
MCRDSTSKSYMKHVGSCRDGWKHKGLTGHEDMRKRERIGMHKVNPQFRRLGESERARVHVMSYQTLPLACSNVFSPKFVVLVLSSILSNES